MDRISKIIKDIRELKIQGARELAKTGARALEIAAKKSRARTKKAFFTELEKITRNLRKARPTEPALRNVLGSVLVKVQKAELEDVNKLRSYTVKVCDEQLRELQDALGKIAKVGSGQIENDDRVLVHCHSHSVVAILVEAKRQGKKFEVTVTETRPLYQGKITARELLKTGIPVTYCIDSAIGRVMKKTDKVLVGCDAILADGSIVNKIGTFPLALVADKFEVPVLVAGGTYKFDPKTLLGFPEPIEERDPKEVIDPKKLPKAKIINPAFDITPAEYIHCLITEKGIVAPAMVRQLLV